MARYSKQAREKIGETMREFRAGKLRSSSGEAVTKTSQALAIAISKAREAGLKVPERPEG